MGLKIIETNQHYMKSSTDFLKNTQNSSLVSYYAIDKSSCKQVYNAVCIFLRRFEITLPRTYYVFPTFFLLCQPIVLLLGLTGFENHRSQLKPQPLVHTLSSSPPMRLCDSTNRLDFFASSQKRTVQLFKVLGGRGGSRMERRVPGKTRSSSCEKVREIRLMCLESRC